MSVFDYDKNQDNQKPFHAAGMAENAAKRATEDNQDKYAKQDNTPSGGNEEHYSLNDDRRVKVLSPGALVAKRFFRNRLAVVGLSILVFMFVFSFIGGLLSPYGEDQFFYREDQINKEFAVVTENSDFRYMAKDPSLFGSAVQAQTMLAIQKGNETFSYNGTNYALAQEGADFYAISSGGKLIGVALVAHARRDHFGAVDRAAAADGQHRCQPVLAAELHAAAHRRDARVGLHARKLHKRNTRTLELANDRIIEPAALDAAAAVDEQHVFAQLRHACAEVLDLALAEVNVRGHVVEKVVHLSFSFLS